MLNQDDMLNEEYENVPLVRDLQSFYDTHGEDERDLNFIREQLSQTRTLPFERPLARDDTQRTNDARRRNVRPKKPHRFFVNQRFWSVLAATLVVMLLTGSFIALFTLAPHQRTGSVAGGTSAKSSTTSSPSQQTFGPDKVSIDSIRMFDEKRGWAQAYINDESRQPLLLHTSDGGQHWVSVTPENIEQYPILYFLDANTAITSSRLLMRTAKDRSNTYAEIFITRDAGKTWQKSNSQITGKPHSFFFLNANEGWVVSVKESMGASFDTPLPMMLFQTKDGGRTWKQMPDIKLATDSPGVDIMFLNQTTGWLTKGFWLVHGAGKTIYMETYVTHDGGASWQPVKIPGVNVSALPTFFNAKDGIIKGIMGSGTNIKGKSYMTHDGGFTWSEVNLAFGYPHSVISPQRWRWIETPSHASPILHITNDAGLHWTTLQPKGFKNPGGFSNWNSLQIRWDGR
ncbi:hypothetical protein KSF_110050 [Reticulibacter mediterranei]|uniref:Sortilin N-terminal domain-containing protein n=1 Tax=Reticulibacter mediterranei TaxID=2778369 RepID=A0A8J3N712_9CHLR|nr:hypothetical protein [Reticulibacter mediterranei]GHP00958.1 hypothetical protein KSF_110050 [Reticulibacter mediterranei]